MMVKTGVKLAENFSSSEFVNENLSEFPLDMLLVSKLQKLRDILGVPVRVVSGYRSEDYNQQVGGVANSQHLYGKAADIKVEGFTVEEVAKVAEAVGFSGIGVYDDDGNYFVHVDVRENKNYWVDSPGGNLISVKDLPGAAVNITKSSLPKGFSTAVAAGVVLVAGLLIFGGD